VLLIPTGEIPLWPDHPSGEDLLGFADIAAPIGAAIRRERLDPVAIGVFGDWGSGKTTVLKLVGDEFDATVRLTATFAMCSWSGRSLGNMTRCLIPRRR
jgi:hypothetical protein